MYLIFDSVNKLDGSQSRGWLKFGTVQGYHHIVELLVKTAYAVFAAKDFHIYDKSILISVHANSIDSIYADLGGLVVWYLKRWPGFNSQPGLILSAVNSFQLII